MALSIASTRLRHGSIRDAAALLDSYEWNPRGRAAYDGSVLIAVQDLNRATSSLKEHTERHRDIERPNLETNKR